MHSNRELESCFVRVIGKRKKMLEDMMPGLRGELGSHLAVEGVMTGEGIEWLQRLLETRCMCGPLCHAANEYNDDEQLLCALDEMLKMRRELSSSGLLRAEQLAKLDDAVKARYLTLNLPTDTFSSVVSDALHKLKDSSWQICICGLDTLGKLAPTGLAVHAAAVVATLDYSSMHSEALQTKPGEAKVVEVDRGEAVRLRLFPLNVVWRRPLLVEEPRQQRRSNRR